MGRQTECTTIEPNSADRIQRHSISDDWLSFNRHFFLRSAKADSTVAAEIASISPTYEVDRLFDIYARSLKRMRKQGHKAMVMNCDQDFKLFISYEPVEDPFAGADAMKSPEQQLFHAVAMDDHDRVFTLLDDGIDLNLKKSTRC